MPATWEDLLAMAARLEPKLASAYLLAIERLRAKTNAAEIARAIDAGQAYFIPAAQLPLFDQALDPLRAVVTDAVQRAGQQAADRFTDPLGVTMRFDLTNPLAIEVARQTAAGMVTHISAATRLALQNVIRRAIEEGFSYRDAALLIRQMVGLTAQASQAVMTYRTSLLELGLKKTKVEAQVARYAAKKLRERALTIARSEIMNASNAGQLAAWRQAERKGLLPYETERIWILTPDEYLCPICAAMEGKRVPLYGTFPGGNAPKHVRCRCTEALVIPAAGTRRSAAA